jgi:hypothetical protein
VLTVLERVPDDNVGLLSAPKGETIIFRIAILDDWQDVARGSADWSGLAARADLTFFPDTLSQRMTKLSSRWRISISY